MKARPRRRYYVAKWKALPGRDRNRLNRFKFLYPEWGELEPRAWVSWWAGRYGDGDNREYFKLIAKQGELLSEDFEEVGRWKEGCLKPDHGSWKTGTPRGYDVWMQAKAEMPRCPEEGGISGFLRDWSERRFAAGKDQIKRFGLSRATTLLHFISGGRYPILDARVLAAMTRLDSPVEEIR